MVRGGYRETGGRSRSGAADGVGLGVHLLDQALMMVPEKVVRVYASFTNITNERVEDGFTVELTFENGLVFVAEVGTNNFIALPRWYVLCRDGTALIQNWNEQGKMVYVTDRQHNDACRCVLPRG